MTANTKISVRALAYGGKFIGRTVGFAKIDIFGPDDSGKPLASGLTNQGLLENTDGSGLTPLIMNQPYPWGYPVRHDAASEFNADLALAEPTVLRFVATSAIDPRISVSCQRMVIPQIPLTGAMSVVMTLPGLLVDLIEPARDAAIFLGASLTIAAQVRMMCGCLIDNLFWPAANFNVQAIIRQSDAVQTIPLNFTGQPSLFSGQFQFQKSGSTEITIVATEMNGNSGFSAPFHVEVKD